MHLLSLRYTFSKLRMYETWHLGLLKHVLMYCVMWFLYTNESRLVNHVTANCCKETNQYKVRALVHQPLPTATPMLCNHRLQLCNHTLQLGNHRLQLCNHTLQLWNHRLQLWKHGLQLWNHRLQLWNHGLQWRRCRRVGVDCQRRKVKLGGTVHSVNCPSCNLRSDMLCALT